MVRAAKNTYLHLCPALCVGGGVGKLPATLLDAPFYPTISRAM